MQADGTILNTPIQYTDKATYLAWLKEGIAAGKSPQAADTRLWHRVGGCPQRVVLLLPVRNRQYGHRLPHS